SSLPRPSHLPTPYPFLILDSVCLQRFLLRLADPIPPSQQIRWKLSGVANFQAESGSIKFAKVYREIRNQLTITDNTPGPTRARVSQLFRLWDAELFYRPDDYEDSDDEEGGRVDVDFALDFADEFGSDEEGEEEEDEQQAAGGAGGSDAGGE
ncbi:hypothetical protein P7C70_g8503, partial [Phenoliferia sp. Uapishka_3]